MFGKYFHCEDIFALQIVGARRDCSQTKLVSTCLYTIGGVRKQTAVYQHT